MYARSLLLRYQYFIKDYFDACNLRRIKRINYFYKNLRILTQKRKKTPLAAAIFVSARSPSIQWELFSEKCKRLRLADPERYTDYSVPPQDMYI